MKVTSTSFTDGGVIPPQYAHTDAGGQNVRPQLSWSGAPQGTKSFAITCYDPDAPTGSGWWHWVAVDIPADVTSLESSEQLPEGVREWVTDYGEPGWGGPCPPPGPAHHYVFTVHALPFDRLPVPDDAPSAPCRFTIFTNQLDSASTTGLFALPDEASGEH